MSNATPETQLPKAQPLAVWNPTRGFWEKPQLDLFGQQEQFSGTWPTSGMTRNGSVYPLPQSVRPTPDTASSSSPVALFRTPLASDASRGRETLQQVKARRGTIALSHQIIDLALHGPNGHPSEEAENLWTLIEQLFDDGDDTPPPSPNGNELPVAPPHFPPS
ncbi:hypothetical protein [Leucobacter triazinivorans]|uniref:hypothetical protein n=1 Tax=Leucobacter triazinivorans TaxID=1784719 RepID=UPI001F0ECA7F|nr:hypothetical protein [Leucobacter triazinivorans]